LLKLLEGIGGGIGMDSSVTPSQRYPDMYVVSTTDFFYPLVEDPYMQGKIACANVVSDMYAMGVPYVDNLLMLLSMSSDMDAKSRDIVTLEMIRGFDDQAKLAKSVVSGGQTVMNPWPIIGGVAKSICKMEDIIMPVNAVAGDVIVLTKPLGTQVAVNARQWMGDEKKWKTIENVITKQDTMRAYCLGEQQMARLNRVGAELMQKYKAHAATDVTGFGILGHAQNLAGNQKAKVHLRIHTLPILRGMKEVNAVFDFQLMKGYSAETSGGLFICMPKDVAPKFIHDIQEIDGFPAWIIGDVIEGEGENKAFVVDKPAVIEV